MDYPEALRRLGSYLRDGGDPGPFGVNYAAAAVMIAAADEIDRLSKIERSGEESA